ncbi:MAG TPA: S8 family serine peptidase [Vicinamibacteria bacterium]|nr:S8 family serine peptidase [Vicinamibacteria bacterium]
MGAHFQPRAAVAVLAALLSAVAPATTPGSPAKRSAAVAAALAAAPAGETHLAWVFFTDKAAAGAPGANPADAPLSPRAAARRRLRGQVTGVTFEDRPLAAAHVGSVAGAVQRLRQRSRWLNAVSVEATADQLAAVEALPFVARIDLVRRYRRRAEEPVHADAEPAAGARSPSSPRPRASAFVIDYGLSRGQLAQIGVPAVHEMGYRGEGVVVAVFDTGFNALAHEAFSSLRVLAMRDFVNGDDDVDDGADQGDGDHGTMTLSVLGGRAEGQLVGPAFAAEFILAKTENTDSETPVEEDNWAAAAEWAEALGADVISSSLGYLEYDSPFPSYSFRDMNGLTAISTRAAEMAAARGVVVVNSAGNAGSNAEHNTLGAPADGARVLAVAAVDPRGARTEFSSVGPSADGRVKPDLAAQGASVRVALPRSASRYGFANGTSFSCPLTAGVVALLLQVNPGASVDDVAGVLKATASQAGAPDNLLGWGIVNAQAAATAWTTPAAAGQ